MNVLTKEQIDSLPYWRKQSYSVVWTHIYNSGKRYFWGAENPITADIFKDQARSIGIEVVEGWLTS